MGKTPTRSQLIAAPLNELLRQLMYSAAAYDERQTRTAEHSMKTLLTEIGRRANYPLTAEQIQDIIEHY
jgi:hypothetical protein